MTPTLGSPLVGFRVWVVDGAGGLRSLTAGAEWPGPHPLEARCLMHAAPARDCRCGLYAVDSVRTAERCVGVRDFTASWGAWLRTACLVVGTVFCAAVAVALAWTIAGALQPAPTLEHILKVLLAIVVTPFGLVLLVVALWWLVQEWRTPPQTGGRVLGAVQLWGERGRPVMVGELMDGRGLQYRAPYGRVVALADGRLARKIAPRLGVPLVAARALELYAREFGDQLHSERGKP
jgi:hypothetical protein